MTLRSLGYRTDLLFPRFDGEVVDRGDYIVAKTPTNPSFHWGNFLVMPEAPRPGDLERWTGLFKREFHDSPGIQHISLGWDGPDGELGEYQPFVDAGFKLEELIVLSATSVRKPERYCEEAEIRLLSQDWEWEAVVENSVATRDPVYSEAGYREYATKQGERQRAMVSAGLGRWFGAFIDGHLAGDLGLFVFDGLARYQSVATHPDFRRRGVCGALVYNSAVCGLTEMGAHTLVMVADAHYHAAKIYESVGFVPTERMASLCWFDHSA